jgi:enoyl-CoA hydratase/carnithine racemase
MTAIESASLQPSDDILVVREPPLARVTLNRPARRNAMTAAMWARLPALAAELERDPGVRAVLVQGAGGQAFSAGADIAEMQCQLADVPAMQVTQRAVQDAQVAWSRIDRPTIAVIEGACTGGGCGLALSCDLRLATPESFFAIPPAKLGLVYSLVDTRRLVDLAGPARAKEILFTGRRIGAHEAIDIGLVNRIVPAGDIDAAARELALEIAAVSQSSVRAAKRIVNAISEGAREETEESRRLYADSFFSADFREGAAAFLEKRRPRF